jgi:hypothetical protein
MDEDFCLFKTKEQKIWVVNNQSKKKTHTHTQIDQHISFSGELQVSANLIEYV